MIVSLNVIRACTLSNTVRQYFNLLSTPKIILIYRLFFCEDHLTLKYQKNNYYCEIR